jgi:hypothetical protein
MLITSFCRFLRDESGGYTIWSLIWFSLYVAMGGLAVDVTDAYRNQTLLQSTADASALAGVMSLPDKTDAVAQALAYAANNMNPSINGNVLKAAEVFTGNWDSATATFTAGGTPLNAVRVITRRDDANSNPLPTNFLQILSLWGLPLDRWNISVEAIAEVYIPYECLDDGLIAGGKVIISSNNDFVKDICIHGNTGVTMRSGNYFEDGVGVGMGNYDDLQIPSSDISKAEGLKEAMYDDNGYPYHEGELLPKMVREITHVIDGLKTLDPTYLPDYVSVTSTGDQNGDGIDDAVIPVNNKFNFATLTEDDWGNVYHVKCASNKTLVLPNNTTIQNIVIVSDCRIVGGSGTLFTNVILTSDARGNGNDELALQNISLSANAILGIDDGCAPSGGVQIFSEASVHTAAGTVISGSQIVARGDVDLTAGSDGLMGVAIQAGGDITMTSNGIMGLCSGGTDPLLTADYYRLVR